MASCPNFQAGEILVVNLLKVPLYQTTRTIIIVLGVQMHSEWTKLRSFLSADPDPDMTFFFSTPDSRIKAVSTGDYHLLGLANGNKQVPVALSEENMTALHCFLTMRDSPRITN